MAGKQINEYPESTSPSGNWFVLVDDGTGCYKKVKLSNLPGGGGVPTTTSTSTTTAGGSTTTSTSTTVPIVPTTSTTTTAAFDPDALAFFTAAGITNPTERSAVNALVVAMKGDGGVIWNKMKAIYPFVGGSASSNKFNLKNPADTDAAFRLVFSGSWTHNANGATSNGIDAYANTFFNGVTQSMGYDFATGVYLRNSPTIAPGGTDVGIGAFSGGGNTTLQYDVNTVPTSFIGGYVTSGQYASFAPASFTKLSIISRTNASNLSVYRDGTLGITDTNTVSGAHPNINLYLAAANDAGSPNYYIDGNFAFAFISSGLNAGEVTSLNTMVNTFQSALGRAV